MNETNAKKEFNLKWTWWLFLLANVLLVLAVAIAWTIYQYGAPVIGASTTIIICDSIALLLAIVFFYFDSKDLFLLAIHVPKKYFRIYFSAGILFIILIIFTIVYSGLWTVILKATGLDVNNGRAFNITFGIMFGIVAFVSIVVIGLYRYGRYRIDLAIYRRKRGEITNQQNKDYVRPSTKDVPPTSPELPTSNLINHLDIED